MPMLFHHVQGGHSRLELNTTIIIISSFDLQSSSFQNPRASDIPDSSQEKLNSHYVTEWVGKKKRKSYWTDITCSAISSHPLLQATVTVNKYFEAETLTTSSKMPFSSTRAKSTRIRSTGPSDFLRRMEKSESAQRLCQMISISVSSCAVECWRGAPASADLVGSIYLYIWLASHAMHQKGTTAVLTYRWHPHILRQSLSSQVKVP